MVFGSLFIDNPKREYHWQCAEHAFITICDYEGDMEEKTQNDKYVHLGVQDNLFDNNMIVPIMEIGEPGIGPTISDRSKHKCCIYNNRWEQSWHLKFDYEVKPNGVYYMEYEDN